MKANSVFFVNSNFLTIFRLVPKFIPSDRYRYHALWWTNRKTTKNSSSYIQVGKERTRNNTYCKPSFALHAILDSVSIHFNSITMNSFLFWWFQVSGRVLSSSATSASQFAYRFKAQHHVSSTPHIIGINTQANLPRNKKRFNGFFPPVKLRSADTRNKELAIQDAQV